jgi:proteasome accessory factor C
LPPNGYPTLHAIVPRFEMRTDMAKVSTEQRLRRILAMVPWIAAHDGPPVEEVCQRFDLTPADLSADLGLLYLCGLHPYTPDLLIEAEIRDGRVWVSYAEYFSRPLRLTPTEGLGLLAAAQSLLAVPGTDPTGPLATGLAKLASSLGADDAVHIDLGDADPTIMDSFRQAIASETQVQIDYLSFSRNERSKRVIEPAGVFATQGQWYVSAWCHQAKADRVFRVDRVAEAVVLAEGRSHTPAPSSPDLFALSPMSSTVTLTLAPEAKWVTEQYPVERVDVLADGRLRVVLGVSDVAWLDRLMLRLGSLVSIDEAPADWNGVSAAANGVLRRYN